MRSRSPPVTPLPPADRSPSSTPPPPRTPVPGGGPPPFSPPAPPAGDDTSPLPAGTGWKRLGNPAAAKGYKYTGAGTPSDPCRVVVVKASVIKGVCRGTGITLTPP